MEIRREAAMSPRFDPLRGGADSGWRLPASLTDRKRLSLRARFSGPRGGERFSS
jgi:hypothetical protein